MKKILLFSLFGFLTITLFYSCKKEADTPGGQNSGNTDKCAGKSISIIADVINAKRCELDGSITVHAAGSSGFQYQLNTGSFQSDSVFKNLDIGSYDITVKDADGCTKTMSFSVAESGSKGPAYTQVKSIITGNCNLNCHNTGVNNAPVGVMATDCDIVARAQLIKTKAYDGTMGNLDANQKQKILDWINAGAGYND